MNMGNSGTIVGMDEQKLVVASERDDESSVAVLDRESSSIEILESGTESYRIGEHVSRSIVWSSRDR